MSNKRPKLGFDRQPRSDGCAKSATEVPADPLVAFHFGSNGEVAPIWDTRHGPARALYERVVEDRTRRLGISRRAFVQSARGAAAALLVMNAIYGCTEPRPGRPQSGLRDAAAPDGGWPDVELMDGGYDLDAEATLDAGMACDLLDGDELIIDVQTHHVNPEGAWRTSNPGWQAFLSGLPQGGCGEAAAADCFSRRHYLREMFLNSS